MRWWPPVVTATCQRQRQSYQERQQRLNGKPRARGLLAPVIPAGAGPVRAGAASWRARAGICSTWTPERSIEITRFVVDGRVIGSGWQDRERSARPGARPVHAERTLLYSRAVLYAASAARVVVVPIGSAWSNVPDRPALPAAVWTAIRIRPVTLTNATLWPPWKVIGFAGRGTASLCRMPNRALAMSSRLVARPNRRSCLRGREGRSGLPETQG
jgi:hypothetical protein